LAAAVFGLTIALVIARPGRLTEASAALGGAVTAVLLGLVGPGEAATVVTGSANVLLFFLGLTGTAAVAERTGIPEALAGTAARRARGRPRLLLAGIVVVGGLVGAVLSNDAAALVLTPVAFVLATRHGLPPLPFALACTFVADAVSVALPVSNPVNVIVADQLGLAAGDLVGVLVPVAVASVAALLGCLLVIYGRTFPARVQEPHLGSWATWAGIPPLLLWSFAGAVAAFGLATALDLALGPTMTAVWLGLLAAERLAGRAARPLDGIGWSLLVFVGSMGVLVEALTAAGVTTWLAGLVLDPVRGSGGGTLVATRSPRRPARTWSTTCPPRTSCPPASPGPASTTNPCGPRRSGRSSGPTWART